MIDNTVNTDLFDQINFFNESVRSDKANFNTEFDDILTNAGFYFYLGSLTTPGCDEIVKWYVHDTMLPIRQANYNKLVDALNNGEANSRPVQDVGSRVLMHLTPECNSRAVTITTLASKENLLKAQTWLMIGLIILMSSLW